MEDENKPQPQVFHPEPPKEEQQQPTPAEPVAEVPNSVVPVEQSAPEPASASPVADSSQNLTPEPPFTPVNSSPIGGHEKFETHDNGRITAAHDDRDDHMVSWEASEYIQHDKNPMWFATLSIVGIVIATIFFYFKDWFGGAVTLILLGVLVFFANKKPRTLRYTVSDDGIQVDEKMYGYEKFQSFSFYQDGAIDSIILMPAERFMPPLTLYFAPKDGDQLSFIIGGFLPYEDYQPDPVDRIVRKFRF